MKQSLNQYGFSLVEGLLLFVAAGIIAGTGYYVWHSKQTADRNLTISSSSISSKSDPGKPVTAKPASLSQTYTSSDYKFSFNYPSSWKLATDLKDIGRGGPEGDITVTSPTGTIVHFGPNFGGKGGDCFDDQANARTTRTCTTRTTIDVTTLPDSGAQPVYLVKASDTAPTSDGGRTTYFVYLSSGYDKPVLGSNLGVYLGTYDDVSINRPGSFVYLTVSVGGKDDPKDTSADFFSTHEVTEAMPVLESLKIQ